jgi:ATP-dependent helicase Lhr and Lhr-like helicase
LQTSPDPLVDLLSRFARTHGPFPLETAAQRYGLGTAAVRDVLRRLVAAGRVVEGEFTPGGLSVEWCDNEILRRCKRRSLARLRQQIEPVEPDSLARFLVDWQNVTRPRRGLDALLDTIEQLQGAALPASVLEKDILPQRIADYEPSLLDQLCLAGEVVWRGCDSLGDSDGRIALYLADHFPGLAPSAGSLDDEPARSLRDVMEQRGALFFDDLVAAVKGFRHDVLRALWDLVWAGLVTNDTLAPLRSLAAQSRASQGRRSFRSRRQRQIPGSEGRWWLLWPAGCEPVSPTEKQTAVAQQLLSRYGIVTRETVIAENISGGFSGLYPVFKALEESGRVRRGYFVAGLGGAQFAVPGADERLRQAGPSEADEPQLLVLAATDPANPYGAALNWPQRQDNLRPQRATGCRVILHNGRVLGFLSRTGDHLLTYLPGTPDDPRLRRALIEGLKQQSAEGGPVLLAQVDGQPPAATTWGGWLIEHGFVATSRGYLLRRRVN